MTPEAVPMPPLQHPLEAPLLFGKQEAAKGAHLDAYLPQFDESSIRRICKLGSGSHSKVYLVTTTPSRQQLAMKCLDSNTIPSQELYASLTSDLMSEASILTGLDHDNIIKVRGLSCTPAECLGSGQTESDDPVGSQPPFFFLMDVLSETLMARVQRWSKDESNYKGARSSILGKRFRKLDQKKMFGRIETAAIGVARGMTYLHSKGIVVQDLKPANIGFDMQTGQIRIFDFGMARHVLDLSINRKTVEQEICGTPRYMAPEIMKGETATKASDVYSFGCVLYTLCTLQVPFHDFVVESNEEESLQKFKAVVISGQRPSLLPSIPSVQCRSLIEDCWAQDPLDRPTFEEIVAERLPALMPILSTKQKKSLMKKSLSDIEPFLEPTQMNVSFRSDSGLPIPTSVKNWMNSRRSANSDVEHSFD